jgi:hypothetical protein
MSFICYKCDKYYKSYQCLWNHNRLHHKTKKENQKINKKEDEKEDIKEDKMYEKIFCNHCNCQYANKYSLKRHLKSCNYTDQEIKQIIKEPKTNSKMGVKVENNNQISNDSLVSKNAEIAELKNLIKTIVEIIPKFKPNITNNNANNIINNVNNNTNIQNNNIQNNNQISINMVPFGDEDIPNSLTSQEQINILKQKNKALEAIIKTVHFNKKYPQFHNIAINDDKGYKYDKILKQYKEISKYELLLELIENRVNDIYDINEENKFNLSKKTHDYIKTYIEMFNLENVLEKNMKSIEPIILNESQDLLNKKKLKLKIKN